MVECSVDGSIDPNSCHGWWLVQPRLHAQQTRCSCQVTGKVRVLSSLARRVSRGIYIKDLAIGLWVVKVLRSRLMAARPKGKVRVRNPLLTRRGHLSRLPASSGTPLGLSAVLELDTSGQRHLERPLGQPPLGATGQMQGQAQESPPRNAPLPNWSSTGAGQLAWPAVTCRGGQVPMTKRA